MSFVAPRRSELEKFIKDPRTLLTFEALFNLVANGDVLLPGDIIWAGVTARAGALRANGSAISRTLNAALFAAIGTTYGAGDGSTTFNIPNVADVNSTHAFVIL